MYEYIKKMEAPYQEGCPECRVKHLWSEVFKFCGCGRQGETLAKIRDSLVALKAVSNAHRSDAPCYVMGKATPEMKTLHDAERDAMGPANADYYLMAYLLCAADLTEHGGSVPGWPTDYGDIIIAAMGTKTADELDEMFDHEPYDHEVA